MSRPTVTPPPSEPVVLDDATAADFLDAHPVAVLAFLSTDDAPSERMRPRLALVAARLARPELGVGIVDVAHHRLVADALGIVGVPATLVFVRGELTDRLMGGVPENVLEESIRVRLPPTR